MIMQVGDVGEVYFIKKDIISKDIDKYTNGALLVMLTLSLCECKMITITYASKCLVCYVYKLA